MVKKLYLFDYPFQKVIPSDVLFNIWILGAISLMPRNYIEKECTPNSL